jgi:hypothetical protein
VLGVYRRILRLLRLNEPVNDVWGALNILLLLIQELYCANASVKMMLSATRGFSVTQIFMENFRSLACKAYSTCTLELVPPPHLSVDTLPFSSSTVTYCILGLPMELMHAKNASDI